MAGPILGIDFLRKFIVIVSPEISQIQFACSGAAPPANILPSAALSTSFCLSSSTPVPAPVLILPPTATTSSQPPAISTYQVRNPEVKSSSFSFRKNQSLLDSPPSKKKIQDSVPDAVKNLLQKFPSILHTGGVKPTHNHGVEHHIHTGSHPPPSPPFFQNPTASIQRNANRQSRIQKVRIHWHYSQIKIPMGFSFAHGTLSRILRVVYFQSDYQYSYYKIISHPYEGKKLRFVSE
jgi:hypothetical protein